MSGGPVIPALSADIWDSLIPIDADPADSDPAAPIQTTVTAPTAPSSSSAAQYQHYQPYAHYQQQQPVYQQQAYQYQYAPPPPQQQQQHQQPQQAQQQQVSMARQAIANVQQQHSSSGALDTADVATLNDALGSAGVDLRAEEEGLQRSHDHPQSFRPFEDRAHKQPPRPHFDAGFLAASMRAVAAHHKVASIPEECVTYLALALRARLQDLVAGMIAAARHRARAQWDREAGLYEDGRAAWDVRVRADVAKQLEALERAERGEEARARRERAVERALEALVAGEELDAPLEIPVDDPMEGDARRRRKKAKGAGAGPEEVEGREMAAANKEAGRAAGIMGRYAWLTAAGSRPTPSAGAGAGATPPRETLRPYKATKRAPTPPPLPPDADQRMPISIRDAMFAVEKERGHGGGRGAARGWT